MDDARALAESGAAHGTAVQALEQLGGRGRFGNQWASPAGNLYMTTILRPNVPPNVAAQLTFVVALAAFDAFSQFDKRRIELKWPNDVLIDGQKASGILLEQNLNAQGLVEYVLVGTGVNIEHAPEGRTKVQAPSITAVRDELLKALDARYTAWAEHGFAQVRENWLKHAYGLGQPITARMSAQSVHGVFEDIDETGALLLRTSNGMVKITGAEIQFE